MGVMAWIDYISWIIVIILAMIGAVFIGMLIGYSLTEGTLPALELLFPLAV
jgi:hypothetical protein